MVENDVTVFPNCVCDICGSDLAAPALQGGDSKWLQQSPFEADLQVVIRAWGRLSETVEEQILKLAHASIDE